MSEYLVYHETNTAFIIVIMLFRHYYFAVCCAEKNFSIYIIYIIEFLRLSRHDCNVGVHCFARAQENSKIRISAYNWIIATVHWKLSDDRTISLSHSPLLVRLFLVADNREIAINNIKRKKRDREREKAD